MRMDDRGAAIMSLVEAMARMSSWMQTTKRWPIHGDLTLQQASALRHVITAGSMRVGALTTLLHTSAAGTTAIVDQLERHDLVERVADSADGRVTLLVPTASALQEWAIIESKIYLSASGTFSQWALPDIQAFEASIQRVMRDARPPEVV